MLKTVGTKKMKTLNTPFHRIFEDLYRILKKNVNFPTFMNLMIRLHKQIGPFLSTRTRANAKNYISYIKISLNERIISSITV